MGFALRVESPMLIARCCCCRYVRIGCGGVARKGRGKLGPGTGPGVRRPGKLFSYTCFDGTVGMGRIFADGSVVGTIRLGGRGEKCGL